MQYAYDICDMPAVASSCVRILLYMYHYISVLIQLYVISYYYIYVSSSASSERASPGVRMLLADVDAACLVLTNASNAGNPESPSMRIRAWAKLCDAFDQSVAQAPHYFVTEFQKLIEEEFSNNHDKLHSALGASAFVAALRASWLLLDPVLVVRILPSSMVSFVGYRR
jgi:hypothetical protein